MNIQDIADFLDLVKNPAKYEERLQALKDEQGRLNAVIETVGKASELDKLRKEVEKERDQLQADFLKATQERDRYVEREVQILAQKKLEYEDATARATELAVSAEAKLRSAQELAESFSGREKILRQGEDGLRVRQEQLDALISEYNEKVAKLRSVMA